MKFSGKVTGQTYLLSIPLSPVLAFSMR